jgi:hypothetical protein
MSVKVTKNGLTQAFSFSKILQPVRLLEVINKIK